MIEGGSSCRPEAVSIRIAAVLLSVSHSTVRRLLRRGDLRPVRIGRSLRVLRRSIDAIVEGRGGEHVA